jgi:hypothetical protein
MIRIYYAIILFVILYGCVTLKEEQGMRLSENRAIGLDQAFISLQICVGI